MCCLVVTASGESLRNSAGCIYLMSELGAEMTATGHIGLRVFGVLKNQMEQNMVSEMEHETNLVYTGFI